MITFTNQILIGKYLQRDKNQALSRVDFLRAIPICNFMFGKYALKFLSSFVNSTSLGFYDFFLSWIFVIQYTWQLAKKEYSNHSENNQNIDQCFLNTVYCNYVPCMEHNNKSEYRLNFWAQYLFSGGQTITWPFKL